MKSYTELKNEVERAQKKFAALKEQQRKIEVRNNERLGNAITTAFPKLMAIMDDKNFKVEEFIRSQEFARALHFKFVNPDETKLPEWAKEDEKKEEKEEPAESETSVAEVKNKDEEETLEADCRKPGFYTNV